MDALGSRIRPRSPGTTSRASGRTRSRYPRGSRFDGPFAWVSTESNPYAIGTVGATTVLAAGQLAELANVTDLGLFVTNATCAPYFLRVSAYGIIPPPVPAPTPDAGAEPGADAPTDAGGDAGGDAPADAVTENELGNGS